MSNAGPLISMSLSLSLSYKMYKNLYRNYRKHVSHVATCTSQGSVSVAATTTFDDPTVYCQRCHSPYGQAFRGWLILCQRCIDKEIGEYFE